MSPSLGGLLMVGEIEKSFFFFNSGGSYKPVMTIIFSLFSLPLSPSLDLCISSANFVFWCDNVNVSNILTP